jgi:hypothetical protein
MGMSYFIHPDKHTDCTDNFPDRLSTFFGQVGGYGEKAEVSQISKILQIDLTVFQDVAYDTENREEQNRHWHNIDTFALIIDSFIARIKSHPEYYKKLIYNPDEQKQLAELSKIILARDTAKLNQAYDIIPKQPFYGYPTDHSYLREGGLLDDLQTLRKIIECYKRSNATKVRLEYQ